VTLPREVNHPQLGAGKLLKTYMGGYEWEVEFDTGRRFRLPSREFEIEATDPIQQRPPIVASRPISRPVILEPDQFRARQTLEALRFGIVPAQDVETLTIGLEAEGVSLDRALARTKEQGGDVQCVIGDYGFGKSHFVELAARRALRDNYVVTVASLDVMETPPNKPYEVYRALVKSLRYSDTEKTGLRPLFQNIAKMPSVIRDMTERSPIPDRCPLVLGLNALVESNSQAVLDDVIGWLSGDIHPNKTLRPYIKKLPRLYKVGETSRLYAYLLTGLSMLATLQGYSGMTAIIDESEHYSLLRARQRVRADSFFTAIIAGAVQTNGGRVHVDAIGQHNYRDYPATFADEAPLFFLFALTESESKLPVDVWLSPTQIIRLDDRFIEKDIYKFMNTLMDYHGLAYGYSPSLKIYEGLLSTVPKLLSQTLNQHRINLRELIRTSVAIFDLFHLYDDYTSEGILEDLREGLNL
jgi:hypothetical protein